MENTGLEKIKLTEDSGKHNFGKHHHLEGRKKEVCQRKMGK